MKKAQDEFINGFQSVDFPLKRTKCEICFQANTRMFWRKKSEWPRKIMSEIRCRGCVGI